MIKKYGQRVFYILLGLISVKFLALLFSEWLFYFKTGEMGHVYKGDKNPPKTNPFKVISEDEYLYRLRTSPDSMYLIDTRNYGLDLSSKNWVFANSFYQFSGKQDLFKHILENREELKKKDMIFICHGGHRARETQKMVNDFLVENNLQLNHYAFQRSHMLRDFPRWMVQKIIFVPETLVDLWQEDKSVLIYEMAGTGGHEKEHWEKVKEDLRKISGPVVIKSGVGPKEFEKGIYPTPGDRLYPGRNWQTPPDWFARIIYPLTGIFSYGVLLSLFSCLFLVILYKMRCQEILSWALPAGNRWRIMRMASSLFFYCFIFYFSQCFLLSHLQFFPYSFSLKFFNVSLSLGLVLMRILYHEGKARKIIHQAALGKGEEKPSLRQLLSFKRFLILFVPGFAIGTHLQVDTAEPYHLFNYTTYGALCVLILYTPLLDLFIYLKWKFPLNRLRTLILNKVSNLSGHSDDPDNEVGPKVSL